MTTKNGTAGNDTIWGTSWADMLNGLGGNDYINGQGGNDRLDGGAGEDKLDGGAGDDLLLGGDGVDALFGGAGADNLYGGLGADYMDGGIGNDTLFGGIGNDRLRGGDGNDTLVSGPGNDDMRGGAGNDILIFEASGLVKPGTGIAFGDAGVDNLHIAADTATITTSGGVVPAYANINAAAGTIGFSNGGGGALVKSGQFAGIETFSVSDDTGLYYGGGALSASVTGGNKDDTLFSGSGNETFDGGEGNDAFVFLSGTGDVDKIVNFDPGDLIIADFWTNSNGDPISTRTVTEKDGGSIVTTTDFDGKVIHTLFVDAVGISDAFREWDFV